MKCDGGPNITIQILGRGCLCALQALGLGMDIINIDKAILEYINIAIDIDKDNLENVDFNINIDIDIDEEILENIDINIDIDKRGF